MGRYLMASTAEHPTNVLYQELTSPAQITPRIRFRDLSSRIGQGRLNLTYDRNL